MKSLPSGPWEVLFQRALRLVDEIQRHGGLADPLETAAEVIAKKMYHRGNRTRARDLFDLAMVVQREPDTLAAAAPFLMRHRGRFLEQIKQPGAGFVAAFEAIAATGYRPSLVHCVEIATGYLSKLKDR